MITIRESRIEDDNEVARIGSRYTAETIIGAFNENQIFNIIEACRKNGIILIAEKDGKAVGLLAGQFIEGFAMGKFFDEVIWYVEPENRGAGLLLYDRMIETCKDKGCVGVTMSAYNNELMNVVDRFYRMNGFHEVDRRYYKRLKEE